MHSAVSAHPRSTSSTAQHLNDEDDDPEEQEDEARDARSVVRAALSLIDTPCDDHERREQRLNIHRCAVSTVAGARRGGAFPCDGAHRKNNTAMNVHRKMPPPSFITSPAAWMSWMGVIPQSRGASA